MSKEGNSEEKNALQVSKLQLNNQWKVQRAAANSQNSKCIHKIYSCSGFSVNAKNIGTKGKQNTFKRERKCEAQGKVSKRKEIPKQALYPITPPMLQVIPQIVNTTWRCNEIETGCWWLGLSFSN